MLFQTAGDAKKKACLLGLQDDTIRTIRPGCTILPDHTGGAETIGDPSDMKSFKNDNQHLELYTEIDK